MNTAEHKARFVCADDVQTLRDGAWLFERDADEAAFPISHTHEREAQEAARQQVMSRISELSIVASDETVVPVELIELSAQEAYVLDHVRQFARTTSNLN